jgi:large subunit ribosomal protein L6
MSRIGKKPIVVPKGVTVKIGADALDIQGPKGKLTQRIPPGVAFELIEGQLRAKTVREDAELGKFHGLARSLVANGVLGVTEGFKRELDIVGVGYRAEVRGKQVVFALGYSHPVVFDVPTGIDIAIDKQTHLTVTGVDRQLVGQVAANIRRLRKPDPYKQKGVRYTGEVLKKKTGKTGA